MEKLKARVELVGDYLVATLAGELTMLTAREFQERMEGHLTAAGCWRIILDMAEVAYVDSSGLGTVVALLKQVRLHDGNVSLCGVRANLLELLRITQLDKHLQLYSTVAEAMETSAALTAATTSPAAELPRHQDLTNYPTWRVAGWLSGNDTLHARALAVLAEAADERTAATRLRRLVHSSAEVSGPAAAVFTEFVDYLLDRVDWLGIVETLRQTAGNQYGKS